MLLVEIKLVFHGTLHYSGGVETLFQWLPILNERCSCYSNFWETPQRAMEDSPYGSLRITQLDFFPKPQAQGSVRLIVTLMVPGNCGIFLCRSWIVKHHRSILCCTLLTCDKQGLSLRLPAGLLSRLIMEGALWGWGLPQGTHLFQQLGCIITN